MKCHLELEQWGSRQISSSHYRLVGVGGRSVGQHCVGSLDVTLVCHHRCMIARFCRLSYSRLECRLGSHSCDWKLSLFLLYTVWIRQLNQLWQLLARTRIDFTWLQALSSAQDAATFEVLLCSCSESPRWCFSLLLSSMSDFPHLLWVVSTSFA